MEHGAGWKVFAGPSSSGKLVFSRQHRAGWKVFVGSFSFADFIRSWSPRHAAGWEVSAGPSPFVIFVVNVSHGHLPFEIFPSRGMEPGIDFASNQINP